ncbi:MAG TPA: response regulator, partial [Thermoanaerobaculia bacterium]|nr:response regulator [Thermoanaerobaculia bacterium]
MRSADKNRVLVVEDRASLARMLERALAREGHSVVVASTGEEGRAHLSEGGFALVLTDLRLPGISGLEVVRAARRSQPPVPVVVMTGYGTVETAVEAMKLGALDFLEKPVDLDQLFRMVAPILGRAAGSEPFSVPGGPMIVGEHPRLKAALHLLERVAIGLALRGMHDGGHPATVGEDRAAVERQRRRRR